MNMIFFTGILTLDPRMVSIFIANTKAIQVSKWLAKMYQMNQGSVLKETCNLYFCVTPRNHG